MRYWPIVIPVLPANAMALFPFILFKDAKKKEDLTLINHEKIHFYQQLELLILPFYLLYFLNYCINVFFYKKHSKAYFNICFEKEAYANDHNHDYISNRKLYSWLNYI